jgi:hypothetical protein
MLAILRPPMGVRHPYADGVPAGIADRLQRARKAG